jgi:hypothetical protein
MQNILICTLWTDFEMEMTELNQWNTSISTHARCNPTNSMFMMVKRSLGETHAFMTPTHTGHGRFKVKSEEKRSAAAYTKPPNSSCLAMYETDLSQIAV